MEKSDSQLNVVYRDDMWLNQFPLTDKNVILYFRHCASSFYERGCDNEDLYQRHGDPRPPLFAPTFAQDKLRETKGVQYETVPFRKHLIHLVGQEEFNALPQFIRGNATLADLNMKGVETLNRVLFPKTQQETRELVLKHTDIPKEVPPLFMNLLCNLRRICPTPDNRAYVVCQQLFLLRKVKRSGPDSVHTLTNYYILEGTVYQCPRIFSVIRSRLVNATIRFNEAFKKISQDVEFDTRRGHTWNSFPQALTRSSVSIADNYDDSDGNEKNEKERVSVKRIISSVLRSATSTSSKDK
eukprot:g5633.t1